MRLEQSIVPTIKAEPSERIKALFGQYLGDGERLNCGCARNKEPGFLNLDMDDRVHPEVLHDLEITPLPFPDNKFDCVLASHVMEHIRNIFPLVCDIHRILKPGGHLMMLTPYAGSDDAIETPHHVNYFTELTYSYFNADLYEKPHYGYGAWQGFQYGRWETVRIELLPFEEFREDSDADLRFKARHWRNVIQELRGVMKAIK